MNPARPLAGMLLEKKAVDFHEPVDAFVVRRGIAPGHQRTVHQSVASGRSDQWRNHWQLRR